MTLTSFVFTELANTMKYGGGVLYNPCHPFLLSSLFRYCDQLYFTMADILFFVISTAKIQPGKQTTFFQRNKNLQENWANIPACYSGSLTSVIQ